MGGDTLVGHVAIDREDAVIAAMPRRRESP
jgi:hypothetical protein